MTPQLRPNQHSSPESLHSGLPSDVQAEASRRLVAVSALMTGLATLGLLMRHLVTPVLRGQVDFPHAEPHSATFNFILMGLSASMASFAQWSPYPPRTKLNVGGFYMVVVALVISLQDYYFDTDYLLSGVGLTWVAVWILLYPTIVPTTTRRTAITAS